MIRSRRPERDPVESVLRDVAALADGSLPDARRAEISRRVRQSPPLNAVLQRQLLVVTAVRAVAPAAPAALRARVEAQQRAAASPSRRRLWRGRLVLGGLTGAAAVAVVLIAHILGASSPEPAVIQAAALEASAPEATTSVEPANPALLRERGAGLPYPNLEPKLGYRSAGVRTDVLDGREATTVYYANEDRRVSYTILGGKPPQLPDGAVTVVGDTRFVGFSHDGTAGVAWLRQGRTCILASRTAGHDELLELASWTHQGADTSYRAG